MTTCTFQITFIFGQSWFCLFNVHHRSVRRSQARNSNGKKQRLASTPRLDVAHRKKECTLPSGCCPRITAAAPVRGAVRSTALLACVPWRKSCTCIYGPGAAHYQVGVESTPNPLFFQLHSGYSNEK